MFLSRSHCPSPSTFPFFVPLTLKLMLCLWVQGPCQAQVPPHHWEEAGPTRGAGPCPAVVWLPTLLFALSPTAQNLPRPLFQVITHSPGSQAQR